MRFCGNTMALSKAPLDRGVSPEEQKAYVAEKNVAWVRFAVIVFNVTIYWWQLYPLGVPWLALVITVVALGYAILVLAVEPYRKFPILVTSAWTATSDGVLIILWIHATGDFASPFYLLWYLSLFAVTFRYDWKATGVATLLYAAAYILQLAVVGQIAGNQVAISVRVAYILLQGTLGTLFARESLRFIQDRFALEQTVRETERFRALAEASPEALIIVRHGIILEANQAFMDLVSLRRDQVLGTNALDLVEERSRALAQERLTNPQDDPFEVWAKRGSDSRLVRAQARTVDYRGAPARVMALRDITVERAAEQERDAAVRNEMELARLREMDRFKSDFINSAAHELNTPLTPLKIQLHLLKQRLPATMVSERRSVDLVDRNLERLSSLVGDMLDVARLQSGRMRMEPNQADLARLVHEAADTFTETATMRHVKLVVDAPVPVMSVLDAKRISQVVYNLVSNALKFTPAGGEVKLVARVAGDEVEVSVQDTGAGLDKQQIERLFQPFAQFHRDKIDAPGTGLGLYISKGIVERHGGTIVCESAGPGRGSRFFFHLPAAQTGQG